MDIHILQHEAHETSGHIIDWATDRNHELNVVDARNATFPNPNDVDMLIVLGGAVNVDQIEDHPWLNAEKNFIKQVTNKEVPILGICLGSQLLAEALGANIRDNNVPEIGWHKVSFDKDNMASVGLSHLPLPDLCLEWHSQTFEIPPGGTCLAMSAYCPRQAFMANSRHIGLQFHPEWTPSILRQVAENEPAQANGKNIQPIEEILAGDTSQARPFLFGLLDHLVSISESGTL